jgi:hypothetical protein
LFDYDRHRARNAEMDWYENVVHVASEERRKTSALAKAAGRLQAV